MSNIVVLNDRDKQIINFLQEFKIADTNTIARLFFPSVQSCSKRLKKLTDARKIYHKRDNILQQYQYYTKYPTNVKHSLAISKIYSLIVASGYQVLKVKREYTIKYRDKELRCDLLVIIRNKQGKVVPIIFEIELSKCYDNKYTLYISKGYYKQLFGEKPIVVVCYKDRVPKSDIEILAYKLDDLKG